MNSDDWTCPCGHERAPSGHCIVWDRKGTPHYVEDNASTCHCHGTSLRELESRWPN